MSYDTAPALARQRANQPTDLSITDHPCKALNSDPPVPLIPHPARSDATHQHEHTRGHRTRYRSRYTPMWRRTAVVVGLADCAALAVQVYAAQDMWRIFAGLWLLTTLAYASAGLYRPALQPSVLDEFPRLFSRWAIATFFMTFAYVQLRPAGDLEAFLAPAALGFTTHCVARAVGYATIRWARSSGRVRHTTVVIGSGPTAQRIVTALDDTPSYGLHTVGYVDVTPTASRTLTPGWRFLGHPSYLPAIVAGQGVDVIIVAVDPCRDELITDAIRHPAVSGLTLFVVPRLSEVGRVGSPPDHVAAIPLYRPTLVRVDDWQHVVKRALDVTASGLALLALSPLMLLIAAAVYAEGGPGIIFRQTRVSRDGRTFEVLKFRSMKPVADESATRWSVAGDPRVGRVGAVLRRTSLDELPQLINILRGDMSIVGPRPERPHFVQQFSESIAEYPLRHRVPAGLTGLAQVSGLRGDTSIHARARHDNFYIENWSLWLDVKVIVRTVTEVLGARGR